MHFFVPLEGHGGSILFHFDNLRICYGELIYLPVLWFLIKAIKYTRRNDLAIAALFAISYIFYSLAATKMPCYTLFAAPAIFIITAEAFYAFQHAEFMPRLMKVVAIFLLILPLRYAIERIKPFTTDNEKIAINDKVTAFKSSPDNNANTVVFNCPCYIELMFSTNCTCYEQMPDESMKNQLVQQGYNVVIWK